MEIWSHKSQIVFISWSDFLLGSTAKYTRQSTIRLQHPRPGGLQGLELLPAHAQAVGEVVGAAVRVLGPEHGLIRMFYSPTCCRCLPVTESVAVTECAEDGDRAAVLPAGAALPGRVLCSGGREGWGWQLAMDHLTVDSC